MIGQTLGEYRIEERIGRGGMDTVYRATDETRHREVAIEVHVSYCILRLNDNNREQMLDTVESRTGLKVSRATAGP